MAFVGPIECGFATDWSNVTSVNTTFLSVNVYAYSFFAEDVPVLLNKGKDAWAVLSGAVSPLQVVVQFLLVL